MPSSRKKWLLASLTLALLTACSTAPLPPAAAVLAPTTATAQAAAAYDAGMDVFHPVVARHGMVATEQALASRIGLDILQAGGNAVDAAVAVGFALAVALPNAGNIGGGGFMLVYDAATGHSVALDFREMAPAAAHRSMYLDDQGQVIDGQSLYTHHAVGVPGTVAGMAHALKKWGTLPLPRVLQPAIELAETGYPVSETLAKALEREKTTMGRWDATQAIFWKNGAPLRAGDLLVQKDLAHSLRLIARDGAQAFYEGDIGQQIAAEMARHGSPMGLHDLRNYRVVEREPVRGSYRGYQIVTMPPPSSGGVHLVQILNIMERWPLRDWGNNSAQTIHHMAEAMKLAYADRAEYLGDPAFVTIPLAGLTAKKYADALARHIHPDQARSARDIQPGKPQPYESDQTTHYSVVDQAGNMVAVTYTLNTNFGTGIVAPGTGILLNNEMDDFSAKPGVPNAYGLIGGDANAVAAGKRPLSSMTPTFVLQEDGKPWLVTGSPGGARIITTVLQQIVNGIDFGMNPAEAAATPRFHHQWMPDELRVEKGFSPDTLNLLRRKGQNVAVKPAMGRTQTIQIQRQGQGQELWGYSDPRNPDGRTLGY
ncbi:gamma-glutamyltransferase [Comamonas nitrativorans]|uniref:Glutathione hydrolase proenzyme n=1 Tax=Comamonas nitrativorans TaxID=108437 RepID=A0ABV9GT92_9BURK